MAPQPIESRVESLETRVTMLEELPGRMDRVESQIVQLRAENTAEHSAIRHELGEVRQDIVGIRQDLGQVQQDIVGIRQELGEVRQDTAGIRQELGEVRMQVGSLTVRMDESNVQTANLRSDLQALGTEMRRLLDEQGRHMRVLHEDLVSRIAAMNDARPRSRKRPKNG